MSILFQLQTAIQDCIGVAFEDPGYRIDMADGSARQATAQEVAAAEVAAARADIKPVTRRQMLTALHRAGLLSTIKGAVAASGDVELQIAFDESQEFQRDNPFLASMSQALGKSDAEVDAIFHLAAGL